MDAFPDVESLIPQRGRSCLLDAVVSAGPDGAECRASLPLDHPYMTSAGVHPLVAIELFAQTAAAYRALAQGAASAEPAVGLLAAAQVEVHSGYLDAHRRLLVRITPDATLGGLMRFVGELFTDDAERVLVATGNVSVKVATGTGVTTEGPR